MARDLCLRCLRPRVVCLCSFVSPRSTNARFVLLMHPKELKKVKNGTGRAAHLSLLDSELFVLVNADDDERVLRLVGDPANDCYVLYPGREAHDLHEGPSPHRPDRRLVLFLLDATWPCARKMMRLSPTLRALPRLSFRAERPSEFVIKQQPDPLCLSTIEAIDRVLGLMDGWGQERHDAADSDRLLAPLRGIVAIAQRYAADDSTPSYRANRKMSRPEDRRVSKKISQRGIVHEEPRAPQSTEVSGA